ncbi:hypothetical protein RM572_21670 [Streptomyces sp. DSM 42041]|uniref:MFS transporter n=1 Tax=Streptomyces hazeniae TaxID=3075538 RepID=A0ABU2NXE2_9ACTN|nr:hypothetical protein [Streptomyces sp. DSM 42041]MDT0381370.1 hypothetical protein [Streptomyces sp. DSM 42041]
MATARGLIGLTTTAGGGLIAHGITIGDATTFRVGLTVALVAIAGLVLYRDKRSTDRIIANQTHLAAIQERGIERLAQARHAPAELPTNVHQMHRHLPPPRVAAHNRQRGGA